MSLKIYNITARKLKDGTWSGTFTMPATAKRADILPFEDAPDGCGELHESGRIITPDEQASEKFAAIFKSLEDVVERFRDKPDTSALPFEEPTI